MTRFAAMKNCAVLAGATSGARIRAAVGRFRREEDGSLIIFGLYTFVMMLMLAGVALDLMRFEERRTVLQNTVDRAALAAADLQQTLDPKEVVKDYFRKSGLTPPKDEDIIVTEGVNGNSRKVEIQVRENMDTWFMELVGVKTLSTPGISTAQESVGPIEVSLVLDVSGSMNSNSRLTNLKPAAKAFVDQMFDSTEEGKISISIIPYATQVSLSDDLAGYFNMTTEHDKSNCIEFRDDENDFDTTAVSFGTGPADRKYQRNGHFDPFYKASPPRLMNCAPEAHREIMPFSGDRAALKTFIDNLEAEGNTSIDIGMKWGAALLDPSMKHVVTDMINKGDLPAEFSGRPYQYDNDPDLGSEDSTKVIVLMTDGANTTEYRLKSNDDYNPYYDEGNSLLYTNLAYTHSPSDGLDDYDLDQYSLWDPYRKKYYLFATGYWRDKPWGRNVGDTGYNYPSGSGARDYNMSWPEVWERMSLYYFSDYIIRYPYGSSERNGWRPNASNPEMNTYISGEKDARTLDICDAAKDPDRDILIYSIAFEAPTDGQVLLDACQNAGYYAVFGQDISEAFLGIANSINKLRLTH